MCQSLHAAQLRSNSCDNVSESRMGASHVMSKQSNPTNAKGSTEPKRNENVETEVIGRLLVARNSVVEMGVA